MTVAGKVEKRVFAGIVLESSEKCLHPLTRSKKRTVVMLAIGFILGVKLRNFWEIGGILISEIWGGYKSAKVA